MGRVYLVADKALGEEILKKQKERYRNELKKFEDI